MPLRRRKARELCLQILFQSELTKQAPAAVLPQFFRDHPHDADISEYAKALACGYWEHRTVIDETISNASEHWKLSRMSEVDRNILRMAAYELLYMTDVPREVSIDEAIEIAKRYGAEESSAFINGVLDHLKQIDTPMPRVS